MRSIDADALYMKNGYSFQAQLEIKKAPTVDAVPVVRCKDCRKFKTHGCRMVASGYDDFCSYGEGKEEEIHKTNETNDK